MSADPTWYKDAVIYEVHVRAFADSNGDGIGDFRGLISKLDYIASLGVTAIWLLPFYPSPLKDDGYDIADYTDVNPTYGTLSDVRRLVRGAHARGIRVITELVCNHTSDQHPWYQRARRAKPGTAARDFYVWSDTNQRYLDARIIFKDFETSNWTWDHVANAYFWHRFYAHQPDLNYDNPKVHEALFKVVDFWLEMGIDGLRLDAIPYLYERDGTNCENLPESHQFLKDLRAHVDANFSDRMLLAEANQWPEEAVTYFGNGDECHMAFHFPVMPRLFMALRMEDRFPVIDILAQTPPIPESAQWAMFLRNHDELTLEMVTDEERDYMYRSYTRDPEARINLGIRRRLAPLLSNNRRRIELMNALLFSLPGTPVLYYGDEIGMGDNIYLGDRNGVRTPMQWSGDRNAGFSDANRQRLYLPVILDPEYHYESVNVETQEGNPQSLLHWMKRLISLRRRHSAFGRGTIEFLHPENRSVIAFIRHHGDERILLLANLSRFPQFAHLDLADFSGLVPVEMFGRSEFPPIGETPYQVTLGPHAFYWFSIEPLKVAAQLDAEPPRLEKAALETQLPAYLARQRWFSSKSRRIKGVRIADVIPVAGAEVTLAEVDYAGTDAELFALPLRPAEDGKMTDALTDPAFTESLLDAIARRRRFKGRQGDLLALPTPQLKRLRGADSGTEKLTPKLSGAEQSNNSVVFGERLIMKFYRRVEDGLNPDLEVARFLTDAGFPNIAPVAGALFYRRSRDQTAALGMLQAYVPNQGDAWKQALRAVDGLLDRGAPCRPDSVKGYRVLAALLGRRTAQMHLALASDAENPDFAPEPTSMLDARSIYQSIRSLAGQVFPMLRQALPRLPAELAEEAQAVLGLEAAVQERLRHVLERPVSAARIRCHGDFHLGQVLYTGSDYIIIDFEGEPGRPLRDRRLKRWALKDVAGMLRSFEYAGFSGLSARPAGTVTKPMEACVRLWTTAASAAFLESYVATAGTAPFMPRTVEERSIVLQTMLIEKALYELRYELDNRPGWVSIPIKGILELMKSR